MKTLLLLLLIQVAVFADTVECKAALALFDFSIKQQRPITDAQLMMTIAYCEDIPQYGQVLTQMMNMLETTDIQTF